MKEQLYRLGNIEEVLAEMDMSEVADDIMESDKDYQIVISGWYVHIPELGVNLHEGIFCNYDETEQAYLPDFSITVIMEEGQEEWLYYEQDGFAVTLANFLCGKTDISTIEQMRCVIRIADHIPETQE